MIIVSPFVRITACIVANFILVLIGECMPNPAPHISDAELAQALRASDHAAFKTLYYRYFAALYRFLFRQTRHEQIAKDCVQEIFTRVWQNREKLDAQQSLKAYLYRIGYNLAVDHLRKKNHQPEALETDSFKEPSYVQEEPFDLRDKMQAAIDGLAEPLRIVFVMSRFDEATYAEIAEALRISIKTVESRMSKALKELREKLRPFQ